MNWPNPTIAGAGNCCLDYLFSAPTVSPGGTARVKEYALEGGGLTATALVACARLGATARLASLVGDDETGRQIRRDLVKEGVCCDAVLELTATSSPVSFIHIDDQSGERTIFHYSADTMEQSPSRDLSALQGADVVLVDDVYPSLGRAAVRYAREWGIPTVADTVPCYKNRDFVAQVDVLIAPQKFAPNIRSMEDAQDALKTIHDYGPATAVITLGGDGWIASDAGGFYHGPSYPVEVVDTTGAGDVFHGAFAYGLAVGWATPDCARFASAVAALKCTALGGRAGIPNLERVCRFLSDRGVDVYAFSRINPTER